METQIGRGGNSLAVRIPSPFAREVQLEEGTSVDVSVSEGRLIPPSRPDVMALTKNEGEPRGSGRV